MSGITAGFLRPACLAVLSSVALVACGEQSGSLTDGSAKGITDGSSTVVGQTAASAPPILHQMQDAFETVAFHGERRYITHLGLETLEQLEEVGSDGAGHFAFEVVDLISAPASIDQPGYYIEAENAWRFAQLMRDPRVVNADALALNYTVTTLAATPTVADVPCISLSLQRNSALGDRPGHYEADVDPNTGFTLAWREFDANGQILNSMAYESFEYNGDLSGMTLKGRSFNAVPIALGQPVDSQINFQAHLPALLPEGFELIGAEVMTVPASLVPVIPSGEASYLIPGEWLRVIATDGLEVIVFTHSAEVGTGSTVSGELKISSELSWKVGYGRIDGISFVVAMRAPLDLVQRLVASSF